MRRDPVADLYDPDTRATIAHYSDVLGVGPIVRYFPPDQTRKVVAALASGYEVAGDTDPKWPRTGKYLDLNHVPWYARMAFPDRVAYLGWIIQVREAEYEAWREEQERKEPTSGGQFRLWQFESNPIHKDMIGLQSRLRVELGDEGPAPDHWLRKYSNYLDTRRWERKSLRKRVSVGYRCEYPGCERNATDCHHLHYGTLYFEENCDLEALCHPHHEAREGFRF
jgi:hypothetical protein